MKKTAVVIIIAMVAAFSCATPDRPATKNGNDTTVIPPADTLKMKPDSSKY